MATTTSREARRRKIMERGSDRLALITGRIDTLPPPPDPQPHTPNEHKPGAEEGFVGGDGVGPTSTFETVRSLADEGTEPSRPPSILSTERQSSSGLTLPLLSLTEQQSSADMISTLLSPTEQSSVELRPPLLSSSAQERRFLWSPQQLGSALAATEKARLVCSVVFSVLVVLSSLGFGGEIFRSILGFRPLYLVLVTDATLVLARLLEEQRSPGRAAGRGGSRSQPPSQPGGGTDLAEQLGKTLEIGLVMKNVADAVFMDCAVYAVILVCGLSVIEKFR